MLGKLSPDPSDSSQLIEQIKRAYYDKGNPLHPHTEQLINHHINGRDTFDIHAGMPGLHTEVQVVNNVFQMLDKRGVDAMTFDLTQVSVGTKKLKSNSVSQDFPACTNFSVILSGIDIYTGVK